MSNNDFIIERAESYYQDEYEKLVMHRSNTLAVHYNSMLALLLAATLAWALPGMLSFWSFAALVPTVLSSFLASRWLTQHIPRPVAKIAKTTTAEWIIIAGMTIMWLVGLWNNAFGSNASSGVGQIVGVIVGASLAIFLLPLVTKRRRKRDQERLDAELIDD